ncbi:Allantoinase, partial [Camellia lanceoleosa]
MFHCRSLPKSVTGEHPSWSSGVGSFSSTYSPFIFSLLLSLSLSLYIYISICVCESEYKILEQRRMREVEEEEVGVLGASSFSTINTGVLGLKSFMCPLGINDFPMTNADHIKEGLSILAKYRRLLLVHAEIQQELEDIADDPRSYSTYLKTRLASELLTIANDARAGGPAEGAHLHIVHLSDVRSCLDLIK